MSLGGLQATHIRDSWVFPYSDAITTVNLQILFMSCIYFMQASDSLRETVFQKKKKNLLAFKVKPEFLRAFAENQGYVWYTRTIIT
jgi:hypothetical protein